jgi:hypothetical protein
MATSVPQVSHLTLDYLRRRLADVMAKAVGEAVLTSFVKVGVKKYITGIPHEGGDLIADAPDSTSTWYSPQQVSWQMSRLDPFLRPLIGGLVIALAAVGSPWAIGVVAKLVSEWQTKLPPSGLANFAELQPNRQVRAKELRESAGRIRQFCDSLAPQIGNDFFNWRGRLAFRHNQSFQAHSCLSRRLHSWTWTFVEACPARPAGRLQKRPAAGPLRPWGYGGSQHTPFSTSAALRQAEIGGSACFNGGFSRGFSRSKGGSAGFDRGSAGSAAPKNKMFASPKG